MLFALLWFTPTQPLVAAPDSEKEWLAKLETLRIPTPLGTPPTDDASEQERMQFWKDYGAIEHPRRWRSVEAEEQFLTHFPKSPAAPAIRQHLVENVIDCLVAPGEIGKKALAWIEQKLQQPDLPVEEAFPIYTYQLNMIGILSGGGNIDSLVPVPRRSDDKPDAILELLTKFGERYPATSQLGDLYFTGAYFVEGEDKDAALRFLASAEAILKDPAKLQEIHGMRFRFTAVGKPVPAIRETALDGTAVDLAAYRGKVVLLEFWATWCGPCVRKIPELKSLYQEWHDQGLEIVGISLDEDREALTSFVAKNGLAWPQLYTGKRKDNELARQFGVSGVPSLWLIDQQGRIVAINPERLGKSISALLHPPEPPVVVEGLRKIRIRVADTEGKPLQGVNISRSVWTKQPYKKNQDYWTDANGVVEFEFPNQTTILRLWASLDSYVPQFINWDPDSSEVPIPEEFLFTLQKGKKISGRVVNEVGQPVTGARVAVQVYPEDRPLGQAEVSGWLARGSDAPITDRDGRWSLNNAPDNNVDIRVAADHPAYISFDHAPDHYLASAGRTEDLFKGTHSITLIRGISVKGLLLDAETGNAIDKAVVVWGDDPYSDSGSQEVLSKGGAYRLPPLLPTKLAMTVMAPGWAPQVREVELTRGMAAVNFNLQPGKTVRIFFVTKSGDPIPGVKVSLEKWRGRRALYNERHSTVLDTQIPRKADEHGVFEWTWAPEDDVRYTFWTEGYTPVKNRNLGPGEHQIQMEKIEAQPGA